jgi:ADP-ribose pyrophosphatase YjhB (NUDIX family)
MLSTWDQAAKLTNVNIEHVRRMLAAHSPEQVEAEKRERASVAVVLREGPLSAEVLLIERAIHEADPWSGHMAFPGGRMEEEDDSTRRTAARETFEEVGVQLEGAEYLGHVDELEGNRGVTSRMVVSAHAFFVGEPEEFVLDTTEVQTAFWFPLASLHEDSRHVEHVVPEMADIRFPGVVVGDPDRHIVWGLTFRFLERMLQVIDHPFASTWGNLSQFVDRAGKPHSD